MLNFFPPELTCIAPEIPNAVILGGKASSYKYKSSIQIQCNKGYKNEGSNFLTCKGNEWDSPLPKCTSKINQPYSMTHKVLYPLKW